MTALLIALVSAIVSAVHSCCCLECGDERSLALCDTGLEILRKLIRYA
jgi:hypothetical protein